MNPEFRTALTRALLTASLTGISAFLVMWSTTDDAKTLVIAALTPALAVLMARFGVEGAIDTQSRVKAEGAAKDTLIAEVTATEPEAVAEAKAGIVAASIPRTAGDILREKDKP